MSNRLTTREKRGRGTSKYYLDMGEILQKRDENMVDWNEELRNAADRVLESATAVIRKDGTASKPYCIYSETGKGLGCYPSKKAAQDRLKEIEMFKHMKSGE